MHQGPVVELSRRRRIDVTFRSGANLLRGWLQLPADADGPSPCIILSHGFSAVKEQYLDRFSDAFTAGGFASLVFDHPCLGASDGLPRGEVSPFRQQAAIRDAVTFAQSLEAVDPERIGLWGTSYAGGHALFVAAHDRRIKVVVAQVPTISGPRAAARRTSGSQLAEFERLVKKDLRNRGCGGEPMRIPVTSTDPARLCALPGVLSHDFFHGTRAFAPNWEDAVTLQSVVMARSYEPGLAVPMISPTPVMMILATDDHLTPPDLAIETFQKLSGAKAVEMIDGHHFDPYLGQFAICSSKACAWFQEHLG